MGYGDINAWTNEEMTLAISWMLIGGCFYTFTIGNLTTVLSNIDSREGLLQDKVNVINQFSKESKLNKEVKNKLISAVTYVTKKNFLWADKKDIFAELPT